MSQVWINPKNVIELCNYKDTMMFSFSRQLAKSRISFLTVETAIELRDKITKVIETLKEDKNV